MSLIIQGIDMPKTEYEEVIIRIKHTGEVCDAQNIHLYAQAIQIPKGHGRLIDINELSHRMYHEAFETDTILQMWDGGCWIRYKMFENCRNLTPTLLEQEEII